MNSYRYEDISIGLTEGFSAEITEDMLNKFRDLSGDFNPLHNDADYAVQRGFSERVVFGMLTASFLSTLAGMYLPGKYSLIHSVEIKFTNPVILGDTLNIQGTVTEKNDAFQLLTLKVLITNQRQEKVLKAVMKAAVRGE